jgi:hypothetical protein
MSLRPSTQAHWLLTKIFVVLVATVVFSLLVVETRWGIEPILDGWEFGDE